MSYTYPTLVLWRWRRQWGDTFDGQGSPKTLRQLQRGVRPVKSIGRSPHPSLYVHGHFQDVPWSECISTSVSTEARWYLSWWTVSVRRFGPVWWVQTRHHWRLWQCYMDGSVRSLVFPTTLVSDNGPQLVSKEFEDKMTRWGIKHLLMPPYHPASNG